MDEKMILVGGRALVSLGSSRSTQDTDYLVNLPGQPMFVNDEDGVDYLNAAGSSFFMEIFQAEEGNKVASPQALLELKAYALIQHCQNFNFQKADDCEYDIKFLVRNFGVKSLDRLAKIADPSELKEVQKIINNVK
jgi:hypothetical protein